MVCRSWRLIFFILLFIWGSAEGKAEERDEEELARLALVELFGDKAIVESTELSLVTCEPFGKIYSLYGHTGLHIRNASAGIDLLANWGIFNMRQKFFALRFALGMTDYCMELETWEYFCFRYNHYGCGIYEQPLALSAEEKQRLVLAVLENYKEENRSYRYNYFYDNCTTRVRDMIEGCVEGSITYPHPARQKSFRELIHEWNGTHRWARWGNDYLLGFQADRITTEREAQFLPFNLLKAFDGATIEDAEGERRLVVGGQWALPSVYEQGRLSFVEEYILCPTGIAMAYVLIFIVVVMIEYKRKQRLWLLDVIMLGLTGVMGLLLFVMLFSQHPAVRLNAQILIFNPLSLVFLYPIAKALRAHRRSPYLTAITIMTGIGIVLGMTIQHFAEGVMTLALFLLITYMRQAGLTTNEKK